MNERIKELERQCWQSTQAEPYTLFDVKKFAELIVQECIEVVKWTPSVFPNDTIIKNIKEHFGVKE